MALGSQRCEVDGAKAFPSADCAQPNEVNSDGWKQHCRPIVAGYSTRSSPLFWPFIPFYVLHRSPACLVPQKEIPAARSPPAPALPPEQGEGRLRRCLCCHRPKLIYDKICQSRCFICPAYFCHDLAYVHHPSTYPAATCMLPPEFNGASWVEHRRPATAHPFFVSINRGSQAYHRNIPVRDGAADPRYRMYKIPRGLGFSHNGP